MGGRKPVRFLGFRARLRPRNASPIPCRGTWCESRSSPRNALRGLERDSHQVPRHGIGDALRGRNRARKPKKRTGFLPPHVRSSELTDSTKKQNGEKL